MTHRTTARALTAALLLGGVLSGCGDQSPGESTESTTTAGAPVTSTPEDDTVQTSAPLQVQITAQTVAGPLGGPYPANIEGLVVQYTVTNEGDEPVLVAQERGHDQNADSVAPATDESAWVGAGSAPGVARVSKQVFDAPGGIELAAPWRAPALLVDPGSSVDGTMLVPLPLRPDLPRSSASILVDDEPLAGDESSVEVCVQVAPDPRAAHPETFTDEITHATPGRQLVCTAPEPLPGR